MPAQSYAAAATFVGTSVPKVWNQPDSRSWFGDFVIVTFLLAQCFDGIFTYVGIALWGPAVEANPLISSAIAMAGPAVALLGAKLLAISCGIVLHLLHVHSIIGILTAVYVAAAIVPWTRLFVASR